MRSLSKSLECPKESTETLQHFAHFFWPEKVTKYSYKETYAVPAGQNPTFDYMWNFNFCYKQAVGFGWLGFFVVCGGFLNFILKYKEFGKERRLLCN